MIEDRAERRDEATVYLKEPTLNLSPVKVIQLISDPVRAVVAIGLSQLDALTYSSEICRSTRITKGPDRYESRNIMVAIETDLTYNPGTYPETTNRPDQENGGR